ncbi:Ferric reduction oxidase 5 [Diplonema papillatum]|nr:Ferric reduction oxidase 5 [Diplonema papillatum]KAJ9472031.1 Ferric reduction oxidase 5 [Diplonema papillatum]
MRLAFVLLVLHARVAQQQVIPRREGWCQGRRLAYYELEPVVGVTAGATAPRIYSLLQEDAAGGRNALNLPKVITSSTSAEYTGVWQEVHVIVDASSAAPAAFTSEADLLSAAGTNGWAVVPVGSFAHCPIVGSALSLEGASFPREAVFHEGVPLECMMLQSGTVRHYPTPPYIPVYELKRRPYALVVVEGNTLLDVRPDELGFFPVFRKEGIHVNGDYVANRATSLKDILSIPHEVEERNATVIVPWHIAEVTPAWWEAPQAFAAELALRAPFPAATLAWTHAGGTASVKVTAQNGNGWLAVAFGGSHPERSGAEGANRIAGSGQPAGVSAVFAFVTARRETCVVYGRTDGAGSFGPLSSEASANTMAVEGVVFEAAWTGEMTLVFNRSAAAAPPLVEAEYSKVFWRVQSGPTLEDCALPADAPGWLAAPHAGAWLGEVVQWSAGAATSIPGTVSPSLGTLPPGTVGGTRAPSEIDFVSVRGATRFDSLLNMSWRMVSAAEIEFSLEYAGDLRADRRWVGVAWGGAFAVADVAVAWFNKAGELVIEDRKSTGLEAPAPDRHQDIVFEDTSWTVGGDPLATVIRFTRRVSTGDTRTSASDPFGSAAPAATRYSVQRAFRENKPVAYYAFASAGGPFGARAEPFWQPVYRLVNATDGVPLAGQMPLVDYLPGGAGYSDLRQVVRVAVPHGYTGAAITWAHAIPEEWAREPTAEYAVCPVVHEDSVLVDPPDLQAYERVRLWCRGEEVWCFGFALPAAGPAAAAPTMWVDSAAAADNVVVGTARASAGYSGVWDVYQWDSSQFPSVRAPVTSTAELPPAVLSVSPSVTTRVGFATGVIVEELDVEWTDAPFTPPGDGAGGEGALFDNFLILDPSGISVSWTVHRQDELLEVEVRSEVASPGLDASSGYVAVGFSDVTYEQMDKADIVVGYFGYGDPADPCVRVLRSDEETGVPSGAPRLALRSSSVSFADGVLVLSFVRPFASSAEGGIPTNESLASRILYASNPYVSVACQAPVSALAHNSHPHSSTTVYWHLPNGTSPFPVTDGPLNELEDLDRQIEYETQVSWYMDSEVHHFSFDHGLKGTATRVRYQHVYDVNGGLPIINYAPGLTPYSDLLKVTRVTLPGGVVGNVTSLTMLRSVSGAVFEETNSYWNCPVVSTQAEFKPPAGVAAASVRLPELRSVWYKEQLVACAHFETVSTTAVNPVYSIFVVPSASDTSSPVDTGRAVLSSIQGSSGYSPFNRVYHAVVPAAQSGVSSVEDLLAASLSVTPADPLLIVNYPIAYTEAGAPVALPDGDFPEVAGFLSGRRAAFVNASGVTGRVPTRADAVVTAELFAFRAAASYWAEPVQPDVASVSPGQTGYTGLWKVTVVVVGGGPDVTTREAVAALPGAALVPTGLVLNCPLVGGAATVAGLPAARFRRDVYANGTLAACLFFALHAGGAADAVYVADPPGTQPHVFSAWPNTGPGAVVPHVYTPPASSSAAYTSADDLLASGIVASALPYALNLPIVAVEAGVVHAPAYPSLSVVRGDGVFVSQGVVRTVSYFSAADAAKVAPTVFPAAGGVLYGNETAERQEMHTSRAFLFTTPAGDSEEVFEPVFDAAPGAETVALGGWGGYSDLKSVVRVSVPAGTPTTAQPTSAAEVLATGWATAEDTDLFYNWPICGPATVPPAGKTVETGWVDGAAVHFVRLSEQRSRKVNRVYKFVDASVRPPAEKYVFPFLPALHPAEYSAFVTVWTVAATSAFEPTPASLARHAAAPSYPLAIHNWPLSLAALPPSPDGAGLPQNQTAGFARFGAAPALFYAFRRGSPLPMDVYVIRDSTALTSGPTQDVDVAAEAAAGGGYSAWHRVRVVMAAARNVSEPGHPPLNAETRARRGAVLADATAFATEGGILARVLSEPWTIANPGLYRLAPAAHEDVVLADEAHRIQFPTIRVMVGGAVTTALDFGYFAGPGGSAAGGAVRAVNKVYDPATAAVAHFFDAAAAEHLAEGEVLGFPCEQHLRVVPPGLALAGAVAVDDRWLRCSDFAVEADCPLGVGDDAVGWCFWNTTGGGACAQADAGVGTCVVVGQQPGGPVVARLASRQGYFDGRTLTYYASPHSVSGTSAAVAHDSVYVFRRPPPAGAQPLDGGVVDGMPPVFARFPTDPRGGYSDAHRISVVTVPAGEAAGRVRSLIDLSAVLRRRPEWVVAETDRFANWWVAAADASADSAAAPRHPAYCGGTAVSYFDFGLIDPADVRVKFVLVDSSGQRLGGGDVFTFSPVDEPAVKAVANVAVTVPDGVRPGDVTRASQLDAFPDLRPLVLSLEIVSVVSIAPPVPAALLDDIDISTVAAEQFSWAYGGIEDGTQLLTVCENHGYANVALRQVGGAPATAAPGPAPPVTTAGLHCADVGESDRFVFCWELTTSGSVQEMIVTFSVTTNLWGALALSYDSPEHAHNEANPVRNADTWVAYFDSFDPYLSDRWAGDVVHTLLPQVDSLSGGRSNLRTDRGKYEMSRDNSHYNFTFTRSLDTGDRAADVVINNTEFRVDWATGPWLGTYPAMHSSAGTVCVNFFTSKVTFNCYAEPASNWWVAFTVLCAILILGSAAYITQYSHKNALRHIGYVCLGGAHLTVVQTMLAVSYLLLLCLWIAMYTHYYSREGLPVPFVRGLGAGCMLCFTLILLPVTQSSPVLWAFGISKARAVRWHMWNSLVLLLLALVHGVGMIIKYNTDAFGWKSGETTRQPGLAGVFTFLGIAFNCYIALSPTITLSASKMGWFKRKHYVAFRRLHVVGGVWTFFWAHIHHPPLIYGTLFSLVLYAIDRLVRTFHWLLAINIGRSAVFSYQEERFAEDRRVACIEVKVVTSDHTMCYDPFKIEAFGPLQHVLVHIPAVDKFTWHPLCVTNRAVHVEDDQYDPFRGEATTSFTVHVASNNSHLRNWSTKVQGLCEMKQLGSVSVMGPYGRPSIDVRSYEHLVLIGGGIGGAPLMSVLEYFLDGKWGKQAPLGPSRTRLITLIWAVKDRRFFDMFCGRSPPGALRMALDVDNDRPTTNTNFLFRMFLHETGRSHNPLADQLPGGAVDHHMCEVDQLQQVADAKSARFRCGHVQLVYKGRPNLFQADGASYNGPNYFDDIVHQNEIGNAGMPGLHGRLSSVGVVVCGPRSMTRSVRAAVDKHNFMRRNGLSLHLHAEVWD